jgi:hypothetical protein
MERRDEVQTNWMGNYFALIGNRLLHSDNGNTRCKLALQLILNGNHKDGSRMLCQYLETVVDVAMNKFLSNNPAVGQVSWMSLGMIVTLLAWMAHKFESSKGPTRYTSEASYDAPNIED